MGGLVGVAATAVSLTGRTVAFIALPVAAAGALIGSLIRTRR